MAAHSIILAWKIPETEEHGGLQSMGHKELHAIKCLDHHLYLYIHTKFIYIYVKMDKMDIHICIYHNFIYIYKYKYIWSFLFF